MGIQEKSSDMKIENCKVSLDNNNVHKILNFFYANHAP